MSESGDTWPLAFNDSRYSAMSAFTVNGVGALPVSATDSKTVFALRRTSVGFDPTTRLRRRLPSGLRGNSTISSQR